jgi:hypothetical protein
MKREVISSRMPFMSEVTRIKVATPSAIPMMANQVVMEMKPRRARK